MSKFLSGMTFAALMTLSSAALAQTTSNRVASAEIASGVFPEGNISGRVYTGNLRHCQDLVNQNPNLRFTWTLHSAYADTDLRYAVKVQRPGQSCDTATAGAESAENCSVVRSNEPVGAGTQFWIEIPARTVLGISDESDCEALSTNYDTMLVLPKGTGTDAPTHEPDTLRIRLTTARPEASEAPTATGGEASVFVEWPAVSGVTEYYVYLATGDLNAGDAPEDVSYDRRLAVTSGSSLRVTSGLAQNATYNVAVTAVDSVGNESLLSPTTTVSTQPTEDFWEGYVGAGGKEQGGYCQQATSMLAWWLAAAVGLIVLERRTRKEGSKA